MPFDFPPPGSPEEIATARRAFDDLAATPLRLEELFDELSHYERVFRPAPGAWSASEILGHLVDAELSYALRLRAAVSQPGSSQPGFDQDAWVRELGHQDASCESNLGLFQALRSAQVQLLSRLPEDRWTRAYVHSERGPESVARIVLILRKHDQRHLLQLGRTMEYARQAKEKPRGT